MSTSDIKKEINNLIDDQKTDNNSIINSIIAHINAENILLEEYKNRLAELNDVLKKMEEVHRTVSEKINLEEVRKKLK